MSLWWKYPSRVDFKISNPSIPKYEELLENKEVLENLEWFLANTTCSLKFDNEFKAQAFYKGLHSRCWVAWIPLDWFVLWRNGDSVSLPPLLAIIGALFDRWNGLWDSSILQRSLRIFDEPEMAVMEIGWSIFGELYWDGGILFSTEGPSQIEVSRILEELHASDEKRAEYAMKFEKPDLSLESIALDLSMYHEVGHTSLAWNRPEYDSFLRKFIPVIPPREKTYIMEHIFLLQSIFRIALYLVVLPESDDGDSADDSIVVSDLESLGDIFSKNPSAMIFPIFPSEDLSEAFAGIPWFSELAKECAQIAKSEHRGTSQEAVLAMLFENINEVRSKIESGGELRIRIKNWNIAHMETEFSANMERYSEMEEFTETNGGVAPIKFGWKRQYLKVVKQFYYRPDVKAPARKISN